MIELASVHIDLRLAGAKASARVLSGADLTVHAGEIVVVTGGAGQGSSVIAAAILGDVAPRAGEVVVLGKQLGRLRRSALRQLRRRIGVVPQDLCLLDDQSAIANVALPLELDGASRRAAFVAAREQLEILGLDQVADHVVASLPWAQRQRVAIARALVRRPDVILADQPTSMQDRGGCELIADALAAASATGAACLVFGRDDTLRAITAHRGWCQLALHEGRLVAESQIELGGAQIDDLIVDIQSLPNRRRFSDTDRLAAPQVLPFPLTARVAGAR